MWFTNKPMSAIKFIKLQWLKKEVDKHYWELEWEKIKDSTFEGRLLKISPSEYEYEWIIRQTIKMLFIDDMHENYQLDISYNWLSRWLINTLLWYVDNMKNLWYNNWKMQLELSLYLNKENYKQMWIKINGERWNWRYDIETQRKMIETITKKNWSKENDYFEYDEKLKSCIQEISNFITVTDFVEEKQEKSVFKKAEEKMNEINIEDIPF